jgi:flagellar basal-body rod modification protein FlgD
MTAVQPISQTTNGITSNPSTTQLGVGSGQAQMNEFLQLLTTQLKNQDPTQPTDPTQFVAQLAQFSTVEQLTQSNTTLTSISSSLGGLALGQYTSLINHSITAPSASVTVPSSGSVSASMTYNITNGALQTPHVAVTNASGSLVASLPVTSSSGVLTFDGTDGKGNSLPAGQYTFALVGSAAGASAGVTTSAGTLTTTGTVTGVAQTSGGGWSLQLQDGQMVSASTVTSAD